MSYYTTVVVICVLRTIVMNLIVYSGCHDIINTDKQQHDIVILEVYPVFWLQDLYTSVWGKDSCFYSFAY
jgi:hypothetical protein